MADRLTLFRNLVDTYTASISKAEAAATDTEYTIARLEAELVEARRTLARQQIDVANQRAQLEGLRGVVRGMEDAETEQRRIEEDNARRIARQLEDGKA